MKHIVSLLFFLILINVAFSQIRSIQTINDSGVTKDIIDNANFSGIDCDSIKNIGLPISLTGTITSNQVGVFSANLQLVSVATGNILNSWYVNIDEPFEVTVEHDSLVYIVAQATNSSEEQCYGAYGGIDNPTATQIIEDERFDIGLIVMSDIEPNWYLMKIGAPEMVNGILSYPVYRSWYVYRPSTCDWVNPNFDFLRINRYSFIDAVDNTWIYTNYDYPTNPAWRRIANFNASATWEQYITLDIDSMQPVTGMTTIIPDIIYVSDGFPYTYNRINVDAGILSRKQIYDLRDSTWTMYSISHPSTYQNYMIKDYPISVVTDGSAFPLIPGNVWKQIRSIDEPLPSYFGYTMSDSLRFYWVPPCLSNVYESYHLYDNGIWVYNIDMENQTYSLPAPTDGLQHIFTLSAWDGQIEHFCINPVILTATSNQEETQPVNKFTLYPNPFNPATAALTMKYDFSRSEQTRVAVYNLKGQLVWSGKADKGASELSWNGQDQNGRTCASGIYQICLTSKKGPSVNRKIALLR